LTSPDRRFLSNFLDNDRNTEFHHRDALEAAQLEHDRVRQAAIRVYELHELQEEHRRILDAERIEQERLRAEAAIAAEERKLRELKAKTIPKPPPEPEPEPPKQPEPPKSEPPVKSRAQSQSEEPAKLEPVLMPSMLRQPPAPSPPAQALQPEPPQQPAQSQDRPAPRNPFAAASSKSAEKSAMPSPLVNGAVTEAATQKPQSATPSAVSPSQPRRSGLVQRYRQIHQELKKLRKNLQAESKIAGSPLKGKLGTFRREIRVSIGQLTGGKGANAQPVSRLLHDHNCTKLTSVRLPRSLPFYQRPGQGRSLALQSMPACLS
jgi:nucleoporin GLE1